MGLYWYMVLTELKRCDTNTLSKKSVWLLVAVHRRTHSDRIFSTKIILYNQNADTCAGDDFIFLIFQTHFNSGACVGWSDTWNAKTEAVCSTGSRCQWTFSAGQIVAHFSLGAHWEWVPWAVNLSTNTSSNSRGCNGCIECQFNCRWSFPNYFTILSIAVGQSDLCWFWFAITT